MKKFGRSSSLILMLLLAVCDASAVMAHEVINRQRPDAPVWGAKLEVLKSLDKSLAYLEMAPASYSVVKQAERLAKSYSALSQQGRSDITWQLGVNAAVVTKDSTSLSSLYSQWADDVSVTDLHRAEWLKRQSVSVLQQDLSLDGPKHKASLELIYFCKTHGLIQEAVALERAMNFPGGPPGLGRPIPQSGRLLRSAG